MRKGFTLIELLVVVLIIGILAAVAVPQYQLAAEKSRASQGIVLAKSLAEAQKVFFMANGYYTSNLDDLDISVPGSSDSNSANIGNFTIRLHNMDDSNAHIEIANNSWSWWFITPLVFYLLAVFVCALFSTKNLKISLMSIVTSVVQLGGYGIGFLKAYFWKILLRHGRNEKEEVEIRRGK